MYVYACVCVRACMCIIMLDYRVLTCIRLCAAKGSVHSEVCLARDREGIGANCETGCKICLRDTINGTRTARRMISRRKFSRAIPPRSRPCPSRTSWAYLGNLSPFPFCYLPRVSRAHTRKGALSTRTFQFNTLVSYPRLCSAES